MVHPLVGKPAPAISLPAADGETYTLTPGAKGVPVALFFYPKSGTQLTRSLLPAEAADPWTVPTLTLTAHARTQARTAARRRHASSAMRSQVRRFAALAVHRGRAADWGAGGHACRE